MKLRYLSHSAFLLSSNDTKIVIDPILDNNPNSPVQSDDIDVDYIIVTHAHSDHIGDTFKIAKRTKATIICCFELANYCISMGFNAHKMHIGGSHNFPFGKVKLTIAQHGSSTRDGVYTGQATGVLVTMEDRTIYHTGDTGLFYDM